VGSDRKGRTTKRDPQEDVIRGFHQIRSRIPFGPRAVFAAIATGILLSPNAAIAGSPGGGSGGSAFVRVNQIGYAAGATKRAYVMASGAETGATFILKDSNNQAVLTGPLGTSLGSWSSAYPEVYAIDFSSVTASGTYTISVSGPLAAASPAFAIAPGAHIYDGALANALAFYQAERDGRNYIPSALRTAPAHLHDQHAMTYRTPDATGSGHFSGDLSPLGDRINASGGWWDAGDYPKFVQTTSYTVDILLAGVRDLPNQLGAGATGSDFTAEARFGTKWLLRMWDDESRTLYYQVGIGNGNRKTVADHDIWRLPQADDTFGGRDPAYRYIRNRPVFRARRPGSKVSPNLAGRDAAAFAMCYQVERTTRPTLAKRCLLSAEHIFQLADTSPSGRLLTVIPFGFYPESEWRDDLELGAAELALALQAGSPPGGLPHSNPSFYLKSSAEWANAYISGPNDAADTLNLYDASGLAHYDLYRAITNAGDPGGLAVTKSGLLADMKKQLDNALAQGATDPFGFGFPWAAYDTTSHGAGLSVEASEYDELSGTQAYAKYSSRWLANILGANAWGTSLIVGDGTTFPDCTQHQVANIVGSLDGSPPVLAGAAVEGPNSYSAHGHLPHMRACPPDGADTFAPFNGGGGAVYKDNVQSYSTVEPAIDLTATSPLAFARQAAGLY
jgi:endoglucanase